MISSFIYDGVKRAITDSVPGAIHDALGWHTSKRIKDIIVKKEVFDRVKLVHKLPKVRIITDSNELTADLPEYKEVKIYKIYECKLRRIYFDQYRFNPVTGNTDWKYDTCPFSEVLWTREIGEIEHNI